MVVAILVAIRAATHLGADGGILNFGAVKIWNTLLGVVGIASITSAPSDMLCTQYARIGPAMLEAEGTTS